jgi:hypothetical protein
MTTHSSLDQQPAARTSSPRAGLALSAVVGLAQVASTWAPGPGAGEDGPPVEALVIGLVLGVLVLAATAIAAASGRRIWLRVTAGLLVLTALLGLPALFIPDVAAWMVAATAVATVVTALAVYLILKRPAPLA